VDQTTFSGREPKCPKFHGGISSCGPMKYDHINIDKQEKLSEWNVPDLNSLARLSAILAASPVHAQPKSRSAAPRRATALVNRSRYEGIFKKHGLAESSDGINSNIPAAILSNRSSVGGRHRPCFCRRRMAGLDLGRPRRERR